MTFPPSLGKKDLQRENWRTCTGTAAWWALYKGIIWSWVSFCVTIHRLLKSCVCRKTPRFKQGGKRKVTSGSPSRAGCPVPFPLRDMRRCYVQCAPICLVFMTISILVFFSFYLLWKQKLLWNHKLSFHLKFFHNPVILGFADLRKICLMWYYSL